MVRISTPQIAIEFPGSESQFWTYTLNADGRSWSFASPLFEVDGKLVAAAVTALFESAPPRVLPNRSTEHVLEGRVQSDAELVLKVKLRISSGSPVIRIHFSLRATAERMLTKKSGCEVVGYTSWRSEENARGSEVRLSEFNELVHSYCLAEERIEPRHFEHESRMMGPMFTSSTPTHSMMVAYEHGSGWPDAYIAFQLRRDRRVELRGVKGHYVDGQSLMTHPLTTAWMQVAAVAGSEDLLAATYRDFVLRYFAISNASRAPWVYYNTWAMQERDKWDRGRSFRHAMNTQTILADIEHAHRAGVEVYVIDAGWAEKAGDWRVDLSRFPEGLRDVKAALDARGMRLGLWVGPNFAGESSDIFHNHHECEMTFDGKVSSPPKPCCETETAHTMCLVSDYADAFAQTLIRLVHELGVSYFKWDGVDGFRCNDPRHHHGDALASSSERLDRYFFELPGALVGIAEKVAEHYPDVVFDFDVTEPHRAFGLAFLSVGKYFLINNGPYFPNFDLPFSAEQWINVFVHPGPARGWICRHGLTFDRWIPSTLFLTHFLPEGAIDSRLINAASMVLGPGGWWGDWAALSAQELEELCGWMNQFKRVREEVTHAALVRSGKPGSPFEVYEKIDVRSGRGVICLFANLPGDYSYVTVSRVAEPSMVGDGVQLTSDASGRATIVCRFDKPSARILFFTAEPANSH